MNLLQHNNTANKVKIFFSWLFFSILMGGNVVGMYLLEHPSRLNIPSALQMGLYRALLSYNDFIKDMLTPYILLIGIALLLFMIIVGQVRTIINYFVIICFVILFSNLFFINYHNPYIYFIIILVEFVIYTGYRSVQLLFRESAG